MAWYSVNTLSVTQNSTTVTGTDTQFATFVYAGFGIVIDQGIYEIASVDSATQLTLKRPYRGPTNADADYGIFPTQGLNQQVWQEVTELVDTFGPLRNDLELLTAQIIATAENQSAAAASAAAALLSANSANVSKDAAATSATTAGTHKDAAAGSATSANNSKNAAATSATSSANSASDANASKAVAETAAADALANKNATNTLKSQAEAARDAANTAKTSTETARDAALTAKGDAETARNAAQTARTDAQTAKTQAEAARDAAGTLKDAAQGSATAAAGSEATVTTAKNDAIAARTAAQGARDDALLHKTGADSARVGAEAARDAANLAKTAAETARDEAVDAAAEATAVVTESSIQAALGYVPASPTGNDFSAEQRMPSLYVGSTNNDRNQNNFELGGSTSSYGINIQDGEGRVSHYWNSYGTTTPTQAVANEDAFRLTMTVDNPSLEFFGWDGSSTAAGGSITWTSVFRAEMGAAYPVFMGQPIYHVGYKPAKADVGLGNVDNTSDANKPVSGPQSTALGLKAPIASPAFTGTVSGITKSMVGLGNVDNTADNVKPVSTPQQAALSAKLDLAGGQLTGSLELRSAAPYFYLRDTDQNSAAIHVNSGNFYILRGGTDTTTMSTIDSEWPFTLNLQDNTASFGGNVFITRNGSNSVQLQIASPKGYYKYVRFTSNGSGGGARWDVGSDNVAESGSQAGSDFFISRFGDNGSYIDTAFKITRSTGRVTIPNGLTVTGGIDGRAYPRKSDGNNFNLNWSDPGGRKDYIVGSDNGTDFYVSHKSQFIARTNIAGENAAFSRGLVLGGHDATADIWSSPIELREVNYIGGGSSNSTHWPGILFHHQAIAAAGIKMANDGSIRMLAQGGGYANLFANNIYADDWIRPRGSQGIHWDAYGRGITVSDSGSVGASYGNISTYGGGLNGWTGYSIGSWMTLMSNGSTHGIHSQTFGNWLVNWDSGGNAWFPANITAYSDERFKHNKRPITNAADRREGMAKAAMIYERDGATRVGFGAQTLEPSNPEVVFTDKEDLLEKKSVNYQDLVAVLAVDNQEQAERIAALEAENIKLKSTLADVMTRLEKAGF